MKSGIYMWTSPSGKSYIGQATDLNKRKNEFIRFSNRYAGAKIECARRKYNDIQYWNYTILERCDIDALDEREVYYINYYGTVENGYNCESGGGANKHHCEETKRKISETLKGRQLTEEHKRNLIGIFSGANHPMWGKHHTDETKRKISESKKGVNHPMFGRLGKNHPRARTVLQYTKDGQFVGEYYGAAEAQRITNVTACHITACCRGKLKTCGGFVWKYKKEND